MPKQNDKKLRIKLNHAAVAADGYRISANPTGENMELMFFQAIPGTEQEDEVVATSVANVRLSAKEFEQLGNSIDEAIAAVKNKDKS